MWFLVFFVYVVSLCIFLSPVQKENQSTAICSRAAVGRFAESESTLCLRSFAMIIGCVSFLYSSCSCS